MTTTTQQPTDPAGKAAHARARAIADVLRTAPQGKVPGRVTVRYDREGETWGVRLHLAGQRYDLLMPAPGALYPLWRNRGWLGGMGLRAEAPASEVAIRLLTRIEETL